MAITAGHLTAFILGMLFMFAVYIFLHGAAGGNGGPLPSGTLRLVEAMP